MFALKGSFRFALIILIDGDSLAAKKIYEEFDNVCVLNKLIKQLIFFDRQNHNAGVNAIA